MLLKLRNGLTLLLLCLGCALLSLAIVSLLDLRDWMKQQAPTANEMLDHLDSTLATADMIATDSEPIIRKTLLHADRAMGETAAAMASVAQTARDVRADQLQVSAATMIVLGKASKALDTTDDQIERVGEQARFTLSQLETTGKSATNAINDVDKLVNDPNLAQALAEIHGSSTEFSGAMTEVHGTATDFHAYIHRLTSPVGFWKSFAKHALGIGEHVSANVIVP